MLKEYYRLTKPGIVYGNVFTTIAAFLFASRLHIAPLLFLATALGIGLVIASACVFNNYIDRDIDRRMERTKDRALVSGAIPAWKALAFGAILGLCGILLLYAYVNSLSALIAVLGFVFYVFIYGWAKRTSHWGTVVGSISGSVPIVVGYTAVTGRFDLAAALLFLILALWQMPHFYAIAMYRLDEYVAAGIPVLPARKGMKTTKLYIALYILAFIVATCSLTFFGYTGYVYLAVMLFFGLAWLSRCLQSFKASDDMRSGRRIFLFSLIVLVAFSVALAMGPILP